MVQKRFQLKNTEMKMTTVNKVQFASLNNKHYYCPDEKYHYHMVICFY